MTQVKCLECGQLFLKPDHICPVGNLCKDGHRDWCRRCRKAIIKKFERLVASLREDE